MFILMRFKKIIRKKTKVRYIRKDMKERRKLKTNKRRHLIGHNRLITFAFVDLKYYFLGTFFVNFMEILYLYE